MRRNTLLAALVVMAGACFGPIAAPSIRDTGDDDLFPNTRRNIDRAHRDTEHFTSAKTVGKRAKRRARGKSKGRK